MPRRWLADWRIVLALGLGGTLLGLLIDKPVHDAAAWLAGPGGVVRGDIRRELNAVQQYGQLTFSVLIAAAIWCLDPARRRRLLDWVIAGAITSALCWVLKVGIGRARPRDGVTDDPHLFLGPFGTWPVETGKGTGVFEARTALEAGSNFWSMPSSHTAMAAVASVALGTLYPRLRPLAWALALTVGFARVVLDAHWLTDTIAGGALGATVALVVVRGRWGERTIERWRMQGR